MTDRLLVADVGSTTTKAILFDRKDGDWTFVRREAPTTVEAPHADVRVGLSAALRAIGAATGESLLDGGEPALPLLLTSSAGGGLAMVVTGLVRRVTSRSAERAALGAGAILLDTVALDDGRVPYEKVQALTDLRPDLLLLAGGFDGEALSGLVFLAELVRQADLRPKLSDSAKLPVVFAGNANARDLVEETLGDRYLFRAVPNLRPESERENLEPAREAIHELFMEHVMSHAPGYAGLSGWVRAPILPTPSAVARLLETVSARRPGRILAVDVGGATTDVFTAEDGKVFRTVSANLGMSYSLLHVVAVAGIDAIRELLPEEVPAAEVWNLLGNKHVRPTRLAGDRRSLLVEWAAAAVAIREAVREHLSVRRGDPLSHGEEELSIEGIVRDRPAGRAREDSLGLEGYDLLIGSGGILSHSPREAAARILVAATDPRGAVDLAVDRAFMFPHLGVLSREDPELALALFESLALVRLGTAVAPDRAGDYAVSGGVEDRVGAGETAILPLPAGEEAEIRLKGPGFRRPRYRARGGELGVLVDTRGRPPETRRTRFVTGEIELPPPRDEIAPPAPPIAEGMIRERRELAAPGEVVVAAGDRVAADTLVARVTQAFRRPLFVKVGPSIDVPDAEAGEHLLVGPGDEIAVGDVLADRPGVFTRRELRSTVAGRVERVLPRGILVVREAAETCAELVAVEAARELDVLPTKLAPYLRVGEGQPVERDQPVARMLTKGIHLVAKSPVRGTVERIDREFGVVLVRPLREELEVLAWLPGTVAETTARGAVIEVPGAVVSGEWGTGGRGAGPLAFDRIEAGAVAALTAPGAGVLADLAERGAAGLVAGGLDLAEILEAKPAFPLVLTEGFGRREMRAEIRERLAADDGGLALLDAETVLRVGVRRPRVLLPGLPTA